MTPRAALRPLTGLAVLLLVAAGRAQVPVDAGLRERAAAAENAGRLAEAADLYLELVAADPSRAEWVLAAGRCLGGSGRFNDALELLARKRSEFPGLLAVPALLARTHLLRVERGGGALMPELDYRDAAALATEVLGVDPDHEDARLILAQAQYGLGDAEAAKATAESAVRRHPQRAGAHILVGRIAFDRLRALKRQFEEERPDEPRRGEMVTAIDAERQSAVAAFSRAAELDPSRSFARVMLGEIAARDRDTAAALRHWGEALAADPRARVDHTWIDDAATPSARAAFYAAARATYDARSDAEAARSAVLSFYEGRALYELEQWPAARELFAAAQKQNPEFRNAAYYAMVCAWRQGDVDGAEAAAADYAAASATGFADVLRGLPPDERSEVAGIVQQLGDRAFGQERRDRSRDLNHVIACLRDSADAWNNYAFLCRETGKFEDALAGYEHAIEREPDSPQLLNDCGVVLHYHLPAPANLQRARRMYERALQLASAVLADAAATPLARRRAEQAQQDAQRNLEALPKDGPKDVPKDPAKDPPK